MYLLSWLWPWFYGFTHILKIIKLCIWNICSLLYVHYFSVKLSFYKFDYQGKPGVCRWIRHWRKPSSLTFLLPKTILKISLRKGFSIMCSCFQGLCSHWVLKTNNQWNISWANSLTSISRNCCILGNTFTDIIWFFLLWCT